MVAVFTVLFFLAVSLIVIRLATVALTLTGISRDLAQFQALSAFTGSGFTTRESEDVVNHPVRRRIVMHLMLLGNAGIIIIVASLLLSFLKTEATGHWHNSIWFRVLMLVLGVLVLWALALSKQVENVLWRAQTWALQRWVHLDVHDYMGLLHLSHDYSVSELYVNEGDWVANRELRETKLANEGVLVLGIERGDGKYLGAPRGTTCVKAGDLLILYGRQETLIDLDTRRADLEGEMHHVIAVTKQLSVAEEEVAEAGE